MTNILIALKNIIKRPDIDVKRSYSTTGHNRVNNMGEALELYIKDVFCDTFGKSPAEKNKAYSNNFSYLGNQNNPPDIIIKNGDAIEVKKIENVGSQIALNSSYPKDKLYSNSPMITQACRECEEWEKKDIVYIIGATPNGKLKMLWLVYGDCYAASRETYERIKNTIAEGINSLSNVEFSDTKELGRVNKVDPLGITYLRIRGMWGIDNPSKVFNYLDINGTEQELTINAIIPVEKYESFPEKDKAEIKEMNDKKMISLKMVKIKSPNNPAKQLNAYHIKYSK